MGQDSGAKKSERREKVSQESGVCYNTAFFGVELWISEGNKDYVSLEMIA